MCVRIRMLKWTTLFKNSSHDSHHPLSWLESLSQDLEKVEAVQPCQPHHIGYPNLQEFEIVWHNSIRYQWYAGEKAKEIK